MAAKKKTAPKRHARAASAAPRRTFSDGTVQVLTLLFAALSVTFAIMSFWRYG